MMKNQICKLGIDIGSTTVKIAILDQEDQLLFSDYQRHFAKIQETLLNEKQNELYESTLGLWRSEAEISYTREAADYQPAEQEETPAE